MTTRALVVFGHPSADSLVGAARDHAVAGLLAGGADVRVTDLYGEGFEPAFTADEHEHHLRAGAHPAVAAHVADLLWCDTIVLVYPTWWSAQPAILKGWMDRVWVNGVAWELPEGAARLRPRLRNVRRLVVVTTHGSSKLVNALEGEAGKRTVARSLRAMCHPLARTSWIAMYGVDTSTAAQRRTYLDRVERRLTRLA